MFKIFPKVFFHHQRVNIVYSNKAILQKAECFVFLGYESQRQYQENCIGNRSTTQWFENYMFEIGIPTKSFDCIKNTMPLALWYLHSPLRRGCSIQCKEMRLYRYSAFESDVGNDQFLQNLPVMLLKAQS